MNDAEVIEIRGSVVHHFALIEPNGGGVILIDAGFLGRPIERIRQALAERDFDLKTDVRAIILSHGHIDHTLNIAALQRETGAPVYAPKLDSAHISGTHRYCGISQICGILESLARWILRYEKPLIDHRFQSGDILDLWGGLEIVGLPGHTDGHCGFFSKNQNAFFVSDLFANFQGYAKAPPPWFNVDNQKTRESVVKADEFCEADCRIFLNHGNAKGPKNHRKDLAKIAARYRK